MPSQINKEKALGNLSELREKIYTDTDPVLLGEYRKLFKKKFSFFRRSWAAAWLFMYYDKKEVPGKFIAGKRLADKELTSLKKTGAPIGSGNAATGHEENEHFLGEEESKKLFLSIGKNRRLFPREVISLILSKTKAEREDIGFIKILDNYSFVQVRNTKADEIIETLNGIKFRGRTLTVNYAKPKNED